MRKDALRPGMAAPGFALVDCLVALLVLAWASAGGAVALTLAIRAHTELARSGEQLALLADLGELLRVSPPAQRSGTAEAWRSAASAPARTADVRLEDDPPLRSQRWTARLTVEDRLRRGPLSLSASVVVAP